MSVKTHEGTQRLVSLGLQLVKLKPGAKQPAGGCGWRQRVASKAFCPTSDNNVGVMGGSPVQPGYRLLVLDIDVKNGQKGIESFQSLVDIYGPFPQAPMVVTPSGGEHHYVLVPEDTPLVGIQGILKSLGFPGIDLIGEGLYVVAPPSVVDGVEYEWLRYPLEGFPLAPLWLIHFLKLSGRTRATKANGTQRKSPETHRRRPPPPDAGDLLREMIEHFTVLGPGYRNAAMSRAVCSLVCRGLASQTVEEVMLRWLNHFADVFTTPLPEAQDLLQYCINSTIDKKGRGELEDSGEDHLQKVKEWELNEKQKGFLEALVYGSWAEGEDDHRCHVPLLTSKGGQGQYSHPHRRLTHQEKSFVECLLVQCSYELSRGERIQFTDRQLRELIEVRHGITWADPDDRKPIRKLRQKFISEREPDGEVSLKAGKRELLVRTKVGGALVYGRRVPSEYELAGLAEAFD